MVVFTLILLYAVITVASSFSPSLSLYHCSRTSAASIISVRSVIDNEDDLEFSYLSSDQAASDSIPILYNAEEDESCLPPTGEPKTTKFIMLVSDSTGHTAKNYIKKLLPQFDTCDEFDFGSESECNVQTRMFTFIRSESVLAQIIKKAREKRALVVYTLASPTLRSQAERMCSLSGLSSVDLIGPTIDALGKHLNKPSIGKPMVIPTKQRVSLSDGYFRRIEAVEFTLNADDGKSPWLLKDADIIIVGVSRTGKTPLSVVLSQSMGIKVANVPLVLEVPPPSELMDKSIIDPKKVFCLVLSPSELRRIRKARLEKRGVKQMEESIMEKELDRERQSNYASRAYSLNDLKNARELTSSQGWTEVDVTGRAVEETASFIISLMNERFKSEFSENVFGN